MLSVLVAFDAAAVTEPTRDNQTRPADDVSADASANQYNPDNGGSTSSSNTAPQVDTTDQSGKEGESVAQPAAADNASLQSSESPGKRRKPSRPRRVITTMTTETNDSESSDTQAQPLSSIVASGFEFAMGGAAFLPGLYSIENGTYTDDRIGAGIYFRLGHLWCLESKKQYWSGGSMSFQDVVANTCGSGFELSLAHARSLAHEPLPPGAQASRYWYLDLIWHRPLERQSRLWGLLGMGVGDLANALGFGMLLGSRYYLSTAFALQLDGDILFGFGSKKSECHEVSVGTRGPLELYETQCSSPPTESYGGGLVRLGVVARY